MVLVLTDAEIDQVLALESLADEVEHALVKQAAGAVERPERPHYPVGEELESDDPLGTGLVMPAYVHGEDYFATKLASIHEGNADRGLPTLHAQIVLADARTGEPVAVLDGTRITNARTGCIGGLAARELASDPVRVGVVGAGAQARWQTRAIAALCDVESVAVYSPSDSKHECVEVLNEEGIPASAAESAADAVRDVDVVVTATTSTDPVFPADALAPGTLVVAIGAYESGIQEVEPAVFDRAARVFADVPEEVATIGDLAATSLTAADLVPMAALFEDGSAGRKSAEEIVVVESVGSAVFDVAAATAIYETAREEGLGTDLAL
ncbi:ornithine cyclodeaminase family protein [Halococcus saccharolyticus]|uniref:Ornithine cyclodeaminase n=1 Tax=Halococcus saccharolyticus DSM 5350 TaxID=1227455 RepID=M0MLV8_9EURY|nr:ornithine cyclodeaminase family protein [Halococcus saccharolyticus]EMA46641.1 ornithine cyclodeaminase [Halococcus saccharolyticus DSM 5350]